jgi:cytochrome c oxidase assembly factor CtaG
LSTVTEARSLPPAPSSTGRPRSLLPVFVAVSVAAAVVLVLALLLGRAIEQRPPGDLPFPGAGTEWALPVARVLHDLAAVATIGFLLLGAVLIPDRKGVLRASAQTAMVRARIAAAVWLAAVVAEAVLSLSDSAAAPVGRILHVDLLWQYVSQVTDGQVFLGTAVAALVVLVAPPVERSNSAAVQLAIAAVGLVLPPLLTGHSASASGHDVATTSLTIHVGATAAWAGGLAAVAWLAARRLPGLSVALPRFSALAFGCFVAVAASGVANAAIRLGRLDALWSTRYGWLVCGKALLIIVLGGFGYRHRRRTVGPAASGDLRAFLRLAAGELVVMASAFGLAVALSRSPTPVGRSLPDVSPAKAALGYELPGPVSARTLALDWQPQTLFLLLVAVGVVAYALAARRLRARGDAWSRGRSVAWYSGLAVLFVTTQTGLSTYGAVLFSVHMAQHLLLTMVVPPLLALGAPVTLALRYLPTSNDGYRGVRGWLVAWLRSPATRLLTRLEVAFGIFAVSSVGIYFSTLFETLMEQHVGHLLMELLFLLVGCLLFWPLVSPDPLPRRPSSSARLVTLAAVLLFHIVFGLAMLRTTTPLAAGWFGGLGRTWGAGLLADQHVGGAIAFSIGVPVAVVVAICLRWLPVEQRETAGAH